MSADQAHKRILVLSDDDRLARVIEVNLDHPAQVEVVLLAPGAAQEPDGFDLLVVATSQSASEPVLMLARASLAGWIGRIPILIISDRPFLTDPEARIGHLGFPFAPDELQSGVAGLLRGTWPPLGGAPSAPGLRALERTPCGAG